MEQTRSKTLAGDQFQMHGEVLAAADETVTVEVGDAEGSDVENSVA